MLNTCLFQFQQLLVVFQFLHLLHTITPGIEKCKSIIKKKKKKHDKIVLVGKNKLNTIEVLISKALIDSYISHDDFVSVNNVLREYSQTCSNDHHYKTTICLRRPMLGLPKLISLQLFLYKATTCDQRPLFLSPKCANLSKTVTTKLYPAKKWKQA